MEKGKNRKEFEDSIILDELSKLGINKEGAKEYIRFQYKVSVYVAYIGSIIFILIGLGMILGISLTPEFPGDKILKDLGKESGSVGLAMSPMGILFIIVGSIGFVYAKKLSKVFK